MIKEMVMVRDCDGNEMYLGETYGECISFCEENKIDGSNGEYLAYGYFNTERKDFDVYDYGIIL